MEREIGRVAHELVRRGARLVVLFGSRARGDSRQGSDADILAVMPMPEDRRRMDALADLYAEIVPRAVDLFVYTPAELEEMKRSSSLVRTALAEGRILHGA